MGKISRIVAQSKHVCAQFDASISGLSHHILQISHWVISKAWDWNALLWVIASLWAFGGIVTSIAIAESIPSGAELVFASFLFVTGNALLGSKIVVAAWQTKELNSVAQRITITVFLSVILGIATLGENRYLISKIPALSLSESDLAPRGLPTPELPAPPPKPNSPLVPSQPEISVKNVIGQLAQQSGKDSLLFLNIKVNSHQTFEFRESRISGAIPVYSDPKEEKDAEDLIWNSLPPLTPDSPTQQTPSSNDNQNLPSSPIKLSPEQ